MVKRIKHKDRVEYYNEQGQRHREDGPAIEYSDGSKHWFRNGQYHREDGPAIEYSDGYKAWWLDGWYVQCLNYSEDDVCKEICHKCKRNTEDGCVGGLSRCPFKMEQIVCRKYTKEDENEAEAPERQVFNVIQ